MRTPLTASMPSWPRPLALAAALVLLGGLSACSSTQQNKAATAASTPLADLNLVNAPIPPTLAKAAQAPYALPEVRTCEALNAEIRALDELLGPDLDAPAHSATRGLLERGGDEASAAAVGAIQRTAEGLIPFRTWVRKLTGAERYSKRVAAAITAGGVRRAFLKGMLVSQSCAVAPA